MEQNNYTNQPQSEEQTHSYIDELLRRIALPAIIVGALVIILFGLIIHFQTMPAMSDAMISGSPEPTAATTHAPTPVPTEKPLTIIVDAGHGGADPGTIGANGTHEDVINLEIANKLAEALRERGYLVLVTRPDSNDLADSSIPMTDTGARKKSDLQNRVAFIKESGADMLISIHQNAVDNDPSVHKPEVIYDISGPAEGIALAQFIQDALTAELQVDKPRSIISQDLAVTSVLPQSVLVECGFISNPEEEANLLDPAYQDRIVKAIIQGLEDYLSSK